MELTYRLVLTENCNANCKHCFNANKRHGREMDVSKLRALIERNKSFTKDSSLYIMGGEPTLHKDIKEVIELGLTYFNLCTLFTNGKRMGWLLQDQEIIAMILKNPQRFGITVNGLTFNYKEFNEWKKYVDMIAVHCVINFDTYELLLDKIRECKDDPQIRFSLSQDTQVNIFDEDIKKEYVKLLIHFYKKVYKMGITHVTSDHRLPLCVMTDELLNAFNYFHMGNKNFGCNCSMDGYYGLIQPDFTLDYCNQTSIKLGELFHNNGTPKDGVSIQQMLFNAREMKKEELSKLRSECASCPAIDRCLAGCYFNILKEKTNALEKAKTI